VTIARHILAGLAAVALTLGLVGCRSGSDATDNGRPVVVASTTMLADLATQLGGDDVVVRGLMSPGGDPHLYQPTPSDGRAIASSALVVRNGLQLEGWIDDLLENAGGERPIVTASTGVEPLTKADGTGRIDPHFWMDATLWAGAADEVAEGLYAILDDEGDARVRARLEAYHAEIDALHAWITARIASIPAPQRVLVTSHDAFGYFGAAYAIQVRGLVGISTEQEAGQRDVAALIEFVRAQALPAIFVETSVNPALIEQIGRETGVDVAGPLYGDSLGAADGPAATWVGMMTENTRMIVESLGGTWEPFAGADA